MDQVRMDEVVRAASQRFEDEHDRLVDPDSPEDVDIVLELIDDELTMEERKEVSLDGLYTELLLNDLGPQCGHDGQAQEGVGAHTSR